MEYRQWVAADRSRSNTFTQIGVLSAELFCQRFAKTLILLFKLEQVCEVIGQCRSGSRL
jgi:hypothetical protein